MIPPDRASIHIEVGTNGKIEYRFEGNTGFIPTLVGGLEMAKQGLITRANNDNGNMQWEDQKKQDLQNSKHAPYTEQPEVEVGRDIALALYYQALEKVRERIKKIGSSSKDSTFHVDPSLLDI